jgi:hypothetical protein
MYHVVNKPRLYIIRLHPKDQAAADGCHCGHTLSQLGVRGPSGRRDGGVGAAALVCEYATVPAVPAPSSLSMPALKHVGKSQSSQDDSGRDADDAEMLPPKLLDRAWRVHDAAHHLLLVRLERRHVQPLDLRSLRPRAPPSVTNSTS